MSQPVGAPLLRLVDVHKSYGPNRVLKGVDLQVGRGEVRALLGENGAGKSTLVNIVGGALPRHSYDGVVEIEGRRADLASSGDAEALGIYEVAQELAIVPEMSVVENLFLNRQPTRLGLVDSRTSLRRAVELAEGIGLSLADIDLSAPVKLLQPAEQQMICILRALIGDLKLLILDEPTSRLSETETARLFERIEQLRAQGISVLYISHRLAEVRRIADTVTVLRDGVVCLDLGRGETFDERRVVEAMTGQAMAEVYPDRAPSTAGHDVRPVLQVRDLSVVRPSSNRTLLSEVSLDVAAGEVVGVFGALGSGTNALAQALSGVVSDRVTGSVLVAGEPLRLRSAADCARRGLGFVSGDPTEGTFGALSIEENLDALAQSRRSAGPLSLVHPVRRARLAHRLVGDLDIRCHSLQQPTGSLSGGNRQKVALARWLPRQPRVLVLEDPTRGIDVKARRDVYRALQAMVEQGMGILLISSDLDEVLGMSDRGLVLRKGVVVDDWTRGGTTASAVLHSALTDPSTREAEMTS